MSKYFITVDTGGTKTLISVCEPDGQILMQVRCGGVGVVGEADLSNLRKTLQELSDKVDFSRVKYVVINLGGTNTEQIKKEFSVWFKNAEVDAFRESSGVIMKAICSMEKADVLLMAGTGIICLSNGKKGSMITDAWGALIGDKGSGYWIGTEAISRSLIALEKEGDLPLLAKKITGRERGISPSENTVEIMEIRDEVRTNFNPIDRMKGASFAKLAADCAREGDGFAAEIFRDAGVHLARTVIRGAKLAECENPVSVLVSGGLSNCIDLWGESFSETLSSKIDCTFRTGEADMTKGMIYYTSQRGMGRFCSEKKEEIL